MKYIRLLVCSDFFPWFFLSVVIAGFILSFVFFDCIS